MKRGRPRTKPYTETSVYVEYWGKEKHSGKSICLYAFSNKFESNKNASGREIANKYVENLKTALEITDANDLKVKIHTYLVEPNKK